MSNLIINRMEGQYDVLRPLSTSINMSFYVYIAKEDYINISFGVAPNNRMEGQYDVFGRPRIIKKFIPVRDAFVKEDVPVFNYGRAEILRIGTDSQGNRHRSFLLFDIEDMEPDLFIVNAKLKLKIVNPDYTTDLIEISTSNNKFDEYGITWANQPTRDLFVDIIETYPNREEIEVDITDTFMKWYQDLRENNGIILKEFEDVFGKEIAFYSRESGENSPVLEVEYLDPNFFIPLKNEIDIYFDVWKRKENRIPIYFDIQSFYRKNDLPVDFFVLSVTGELCMDFIVSKDILPVNFMVRQKSDIFIDFKVSEPRINDLLMNFTVSKDNLLLDLNVAGIDYKWLVFTVHHPVIPLDFVVTKDQIRVEFKIPYKNEIDLNLNIAGTSDLPVEFEYKLINDLEFSFYIEKYIYNDLPIEFFYSHNIIPVNFVISKYSDLSLDLNVAGIKHIPIDLHIIKTLSNEINLDFMVRGVNDLPLDLNVAGIEYLPIEFEHRLTNDLPLLLHVEKYIHKPEDDLLINFSYSFGSIPISFIVSKYSDLPLDFNIAGIKYIPINLHVVQSFSRSIDLDFMVRAINDLPLDFNVANKFLDLDFHIIKYKQSLRSLNFLVRAVNDMPIDFMVAQKSDIYLRFSIQKHLFSDIIIFCIVGGEVKKRGYAFIM